MGQQELHRLQLTTVRGREECVRHVGIGAELQLALHLRQVA
jgi:hypothetical protein